VATTWITGASSGIGRALALRLARDGHEIAASARSADQLERLSEESRATEGRIHPYPLDVGDAAAAAAAIGGIEREVGGIDRAVLAAAAYEPVGESADRGLLCRRHGRVDQPRGIPEARSRPCGVRLQLIDPGFVETPMTAPDPFPMPFLLPVEEAAERLAWGLASSRFEVTFPRRFTWQLKLLRCLPYALYFPLVARATRR